MPPVGPPVVLWTKVEKLAGVFSGQCRDQKEPEAELLCCAPLVFFLCFFFFLTCERWQLCHLGGLQVARPASLCDLGKLTAAEWAPGLSHCDWGSTVPPFSRHTSKHTHTRNHQPIDQSNQRGAAGGVGSLRHSSTYTQSFILPSMFRHTMAFRLTLINSSFQWKQLYIKEWHIEKLFLAIISLSLLILICFHQ